MVVKKNVGKDHILFVWGLWMTPVFVQRWNHVWFYKGNDWLPEWLPCVSGKLYQARPEISDHEVIPLGSFCWAQEPDIIIDSLYYLQGWYLCQSNKWPWGVTLHWGLLSSALQSIWPVEIKKSFLFYCRRILLFPKLFESDSNHHPKETDAPQMSILECLDGWPQCCIIYFLWGYVLWSELRGDISWWFCYS
jgi:hypothetical protein